MQIKIKLRSFKSSEHINEKRDGPYHGFGYSSLMSDPINPNRITNFVPFNRVVDKIYKVHWFSSYLYDVSIPIFVDK